MPGGELSSYISQSMPGTRFQTRARHTLLPAQETACYFLETTGHFLLLGLALLFCLPQTPSAASQSHYLLQGFLGSVVTAPWASGCPSRKGITNISGSFYFSPNCPCSFRVGFFHLVAYYEFFSMPIPHHESPHSYNQSVQYFPLYN